MTTREKVAIAISKVLQSSHDVAYKVQDEESGKEWFIDANRVDGAVWIAAFCWPVEFCIKVCDQDVNHLADDVTDQIERITAKWKEEGKCRQELP